MNDRDDFKKRGIRGITTLRFGNPLRQYGVVSVLPDTYIDLKDDGVCNGKPLYDSFDPEHPNRFLRNIKSVTDFDTYAYITVDDETIMEVTNMLGVIRLKVKKEDISDINKYQKKIAKKYGVLHIKKVRELGIQGMNGLQAAAYARLTSSFAVRVLLAHNRRPQRSGALQPSSGACETPLRTGTEPLCDQSCANQPPFDFQNGKLGHFYPMPDT